MSLPLVSHSLPCVLAVFHFLMFLVCPQFACPCVCLCFCVSVCCKHWLDTAFVSFFFTGKNTKPVQLSSVSQHLSPAHSSNHQEDKLMSHPVKREQAITHISPFLTQQSRHGSRDTTGDITTPVSVRWETANLCSLGTINLRMIQKLHRIFLKSTWKKNEALIWAAFCFVLISVSFSSVSHVSFCIC